MTAQQKGYYGLCTKCEYYTALDLGTDLCLDCYTKMHPDTEWNNTQTPWYIALIYQPNRIRNDTEVVRVLRL